MTVTYRNSDGDPVVATCDAITFETYQEDYTGAPQNDAVLWYNNQPIRRVSMSSLVSVVS